MHYTPRAAAGGRYLDHAAVRLVVGPHHRAEVGRGHGEGEAEGEGEEGECQHVPGIALDGATLEYSEHWTLLLPARRMSPPAPAPALPPTHRHYTATTTHHPALASGNALDNGDSVTRWVPGAAGAAGVAGTAGAAGDPWCQETVSPAPAVCSTAVPAPAAAPPHP